MSIEEEIEYLVQYPSREGIEQIDVNITYIMNKARKNIEGPK